MYRNSQIRIKAVKGFLVIWRGCIFDKSENANTQKPNLNLNQKKCSRIPLLFIYCTFCCYFKSVIAKLQILPGTARTLVSKSGSRFSEGGGEWGS